jgi:hypothetical protein
MYRSEIRHADANAHAPMSLREYVLIRVLYWTSPETHIIAVDQHRGNRVLLTVRSCWTNPCYGDGCVNCLTCSLMGSLEWQRRKEFGMSVNRRACSCALKDESSWRISRGSMGICGDQRSSRDSRRSGRFRATQAGQSIARQCDSLRS